MQKSIDRVIIDTNIWISFLIVHDFKQLDVSIKSGKIRILFSTELMEEFLSVCQRPKFRKYFELQDIEQLLDLFDVYGEMIQVKSQLSVCRDPKDNFLLSLAVDSNATHLITGDQDLLDLKQITDTRIVTINDYLQSYH